MIECIEIMVKSWIVRFLIEVGALFVLVAFVVIAALVLIADDEVRERGRKNEVSEARKERKATGNRHTDKPV